MLSVLASLLALSDENVLGRGLVFIAQDSVNVIQEQLPQCLFGFAEHIVTGISGGNIKPMPGNDRAGVYTFVHVVQGACEFRFPVNQGVDVGMNTTVLRQRSTMTVNYTLTKKC